MRIKKTVDRGSKEKLYVQIYSILIEKIENREWSPGTQIPPEDELCRTYDVSKVTVREAIQELVREGYLKRQQGKGTFVTCVLPQIGIVMRTRVTDDIFGEEVNVQKEIIRKEIKEIPDSVRQFLRTDTNVYYFSCKKIANEELFHEEIFIPEFIFAHIEEVDIASRSLYDLIEEKGTKKIFRVIQEMEVTEIQNEISVTLNMRKGAPALLIKRTLMSTDGVPVAHTRVVGCSRKQTFQMEFERFK